MKVPTPRQAAKVMLVFNACQAVLWLVMIPVSLETGLKRSVPFLVFLSVWALEVGAIAATVAGMAALRAEQQAEDS